MRGDTARKWEVANLIFDERLFDLVRVLHRITAPPMAGNVPHELLGGMALARLFRQGQERRSPEPEA
jgi:hypothetical protein